MNAPLPRLLCVLALGVLVTPTLPAQAQRLELPRPSPNCTLKQRVGLTDIEVVYSRPGMKGRHIFGTGDVLVPYGEVWRTGANEATRITFSTAVKFGGADVPAGTYALFSIPGPQEWTVILNKVTGQWGAYSYDAKNDLVRVTVPAMSVAEPMETFTIDVNDIRDDSATLNLEWDRTRVPVKLGVDVVAAVKPQIERAMARMTGTYDGAAMFYLEQGLDLQQASAWMDLAIAQQPDAFFLYYHKAQILAKLGDKPGAIAAARHSIELAAKDGGPAKAEYTRLNETLIASLGQ
ncbi:MAG TPA: DUF2911 domain-containing protein [Opitutaceae bacterium]|nr:DUF2911 domain-containing protein [Opitutaceae bacterium]